MTKVATKTTTMNLRLDVETRQQLQSYADNLGIPATTLVVANIKQLLKSDEVRFTRTLEPTPYLVKIMEQTEADIKAGKKFAGPFNGKEAVAYLNSLVE
jgi:hypothetical protein